jgi:hypothetical protein
MFTRMIPLWTYFFGNGLAIAAGYLLARYYVYRRGFKDGMDEGRAIERLRWLSMEDQTRRQKRQDHREALRLETERRQLSKYKIVAIERPTRRLRRRKETS